MSENSYGQPVPEPYVYTVKPKRTIGFVGNPIAGIDVVTHIPYEEAERFKKAFGLKENPWNP